MGASSSVQTTVRADKLTLALHSSSLKAQSTLRNLIPDVDSNDDELEREREGTPQPSESRPSPAQLAVAKLSIHHAGGVHRKHLGGFGDGTALNKYILHEGEEELEGPTLGAVVKKWNDRYEGWSKVHDSKEKRFERFREFASRRPTARPEVRDDGPMPVWRPPCDGPAPGACSFPFTEMDARELGHVAGNLVAHDDLFLATGEPGARALRFEAAQGPWRLASLQSSAKRSGINAEQLPGPLERGESTSTSESGTAASGSSETGSVSAPQVTEIDQHMHEENTQKVETCLAVLQTAADKWRALEIAASNEGKPPPSIGKFDTLILRPLFRELLTLEALGLGLNVLEEVAKCRLEPFLQIYLSMVQERFQAVAAPRGQDSREAMVLRLCAMTGCACSAALQALRKGGWDYCTALRIAQKQPVKSAQNQESESREAGKLADALALGLMPMRQRSSNQGPAQEGAEGTSINALDLALRAVRQHDLHQMEHVASMCSPKELTLALTTAISLERIDRKVLSFLLGSVGPAARRSVLLLAASRGLVDALGTIVQSPGAVTHDDIQAAVVVAAKRGNDGVLQLLLCQADNATLSKALIAAATTDQVLAVRRTLHLAAKEARLRALTAVEHLARTSARPQRAARVIRSWADVEACRDVQFAAKPRELSGASPAESVCQDAMDVEQLLGALLQAGLGNFQGRCLFDLRAFEGRAALAASLSRDFARVYGFEAQATAFEKASRVAAARTKDLEEEVVLGGGDDGGDCGGDDAEGAGSPPRPQTDIRFWCCSFREKAAMWTAHGDLLLASKTALPNEEELESLQAGAVIAYYLPKQCGVFKNPNREALEVVATVRNPRDERDVRWRAFRRRSEETE